MQDGFASRPHELTAQQLSDSLNNETATERINDLDKRSHKGIERSYKVANKFALSDADNTEQRVINAFLKGEGLEKITIDEKEYNALVFDENSEQSKGLNKSDIFMNYFDEYKSCMKDIINKAINDADFDINTIPIELEKKLGKPNFSNIKTIGPEDYYALFGGIQKVDIDFEITPISGKEYSLKTKMYLTDFYAADSDDVSTEIDLQNSISNIKFISSRIIDNLNPISSTPKGVNDLLIGTGLMNLPSSIMLDLQSFKSHIPGLKELFMLQHKYGRKPFATQIIYQSTDEITLD